MGKEKRPEKNSFLLHKDQWEPISDLTDDELGQMLRAIFDYQINDVEPERASPIFAYFKFFKARFSFEETKYVEISNGNAERGRLGGIASAESRRLKKEANEANASISSESKQTQANQADKDKDKGIDKDNVLESEKSEKMGPISKTLTEANESPWLWIKARKMIQCSELIVKYTFIDTEVKCLEWEKYLLANKPDSWERKDIKQIWSSLDWYLQTANNTAERFAKEKAKPKPSYTPEIPKMNPLKSAFD